VRLVVDVVVEGEIQQMRSVEAHDAVLVERKRHQRQLVRFFLGVDDWKLHNFTRRLKKKIK